MKKPELTESGEIYLLGAATMQGMPAGQARPGRGFWPMLNRLRRMGFIVRNGNVYDCTPQGRLALVRAGYFRPEVAE